MLMLNESHSTADQHTIQYIYIYIYVDEQCYISCTATTWHGSARMGTRAVQQIRFSCSFYYKGPQLKGLCSEENILGLKKH